MSDSDLTLQESQPSRADAVKNRALLLETAARLFAEAAHAGLTIESVSASDITEAAGVGKGTLYRHFPNGRPDLCLALLDEDQRDLQERTLAQLRLDPNPRENLNWFLLEVVDFIERNRALLSALVGDTSSLVVPAHWWWRQTIHGLLSQIGTADDLDHLTDTLYVLVDVRTIHYLRDQRGYHLERVKRNLLNTVSHLVSR